METLNAKQEAIKNAYGEYWELVKDLVRTDGSLSEPVWRGSNINIDYDDFSTGYFRPKLLQGIENNNGWIRIENEDDLPKEYCKLHVFPPYQYNDMFLFYNDELSKKELIKNHTHYQPIEKPKPPIY